MKEVLEFNVMLEWESPQDNSNSKGDHYTVQKVMGKLLPLPLNCLPSESPNDGGPSQPEEDQCSTSGLGQNPRHMDLLLVAGGPPDTTPSLSWGAILTSGSYLETISGRAHQNLDLFGELPRYMSPPGCGGHPK